MIMRISVVPDYKRGKGNLLINHLAYLAPEDFLPVVPEADMAELDGMLAATCTCSVCFVVAACKQSCLDVATSTKGSVTGDECLPCE